MIETMARAAFEASFPYSKWDDAPDWMRVAELRRQAAALAALTALGLVNA